MIQMGSGKTYLKECFNDCREEIDTNIFNVSFSAIEDENNKYKIHQGDPLYCQNCKGILNKYSNLNLLAKSGSISQHQWKCEFCSHTSEIQIELDDVPESEEALYLIEPHFKQQTQNCTEKSSITFCIDTSGSMSTTTEVKGKVDLQLGFSQKEKEMLKKFIQPGIQDQFGENSKQISYVSRKQCLLSAIEQQIKKLKSQNSDKVVGLVTFNNEVVVYGDGSQQPIKFSEQQLYQEVEIKTVLSRCAKQMMQNPITKQADNIINICEQLQDNGQTALGPALISALELAKVGKPGSMIIICTDGLANLGLGAIDCESNKKFYEELGQMAAEKGIIISLVTIKGEGCKVDTLGALVEKTNGIVTRVNPENIGQDFTNIINDIVIGTQVELKVILHKALKFRREDNANKGNTLKKYMGNITKSTIQTFEYQLKTEKELKKENIDIKQLKQIPFQIRITYTNLKGEKMMRVVTKLIQTTQNIEEAEKEAQVDVIHKRMAQKTAQIAQKGNYEEAQIYNQYWNQYLQNNPYINSKQINYKKNQIFQKHNEKLSHAIKNQEVRKQQSIQFQGTQGQQPIINQNSKCFQPKETTQTSTGTLIYPSIPQNIPIPQSICIKTPLDKENNHNKIEKQLESQKETITQMESKLYSNVYTTKIQSNSFTTIDSKSNKSKNNSNEYSSQSNESDEDQDFTTLLFYRKAKF